MTMLPDAPKPHREPMKGLKNGCWSAVFWGLVAVVVAAVVGYFVSVWIADETAEELREDAPAVPGEIIDDS